MIINSSNNHQMLSKDKQKKPINSSFSHLEEIEITSNKDKVYYPNWNNEPQEQISLVKWNDTHLLSKGGIMCLMARTGVGKSSVTEAFITSHLNPNCDSLGVKLNLGSKRNKVLICDTERSDWESHKAWLKMMKRAGIDKGVDISKKLVFANLKSLSVNEKICFIDDFLKENNDVGLIVFDGSSDFIYNTNDNVECGKFYEWITSLNRDIGFIFTIHTNPTDNKPRGHLGTILLQKSESVLLATKQEDIFEITTDSEHGKLRHSKGITFHYKYCDENDMFVSTDEMPMPKKQPSKSNQKWKQIAMDIFNENELLSFADIVRGIETKTGKDFKKSKSTFFDSFQDKICEKVIINEKPFWKLIKP